MVRYAGLDVGIITAGPFPPMINQKTLRELYLLKGLV